MNCERCLGLMVQDECHAMGDGWTDLWSWRCVSCGNIMDSVIMQNRVKRSQISGGRDATRSSRVTMDSAAA
jgi:hypothetical protein